MSCYAYTDLIKENPKHIIKLTEEQLYNQIKQALESNPDLKKSGFDVAVYSSAISNEVIIKSLYKESKEGYINQLVNKYRFIGVNKYNTLPTTREHALISPYFDVDSYKRNFYDQMINAGYSEAVIDRVWNELAFERAFVQGKGISVHRLLEHLFSDKHLRTTEISKKYSNPNFELIKQSIVLDLLKTYNKEIQDYLIASDYTVETFVDQLAAQAIDIHNALLKTYHPSFFAAEMRIINIANNNSIREEEIGGRKIKTIRNKWLNIPTNAGTGVQGVQGIMDLCFVDENNKIHIVDYKITQYEWDNARGWNQVKLRTTYALLLAYKRMLQAQGINGNDIILEILPILAPKELKGQLEVDPACRRADGSIKPIDVTYLAESYTNLGVRMSSNFYNPSIAELRVLLDSRISEIIDIDQANLFSSNIHTIEERALTKEELENKVRDTRGAAKPDGTPTYRLYDETTGEYKDYTLEELHAKEDGKDVLDAYIEKYKEWKKTTVKTIWNQLSLAKESDLDINDIVFFSGREREIQNTNLKNLIAPYMNDEYELLNTPELVDNNIIAFRRTSGKPQVVLLCVSDLNPETEYPIAGQFNVAGNFKTDRENKDNNLGYLPSNGKYTAALKALTIVNRLKSNAETDLFKLSDGTNVPISSLYVIKNGSFTSVDLSGELAKLERNCFDLINLANLNPELQEKIPITQDRKLVYNAAEGMVIHVSNLIPDILKNSTAKNKEAVLNAIAVLNNYDASIPDKVKAVDSLMYLIRSLAPNRYTVHGINDIPHTNQTSDALDQAYLFLNKVLIGLGNKSGVSLDTGVTDYALGLSYVFKAIRDAFVLNGSSASHTRFGHTDTGSLGGFMTTAISYTPDEVVKYLTEQTDRASQSARSILFKKINQIEKTTKDWGEGKSYNIANVTSLKNNYKKYERFYLKDATGALDSNLILINPYNEQNNLTFGERKFLQEILWLINRERSSLIPNQYKMMSWEKFQESNPELIRTIKKLDQSDDWFLAPLARATTVERMRAGNKSIRQLIKQHWDDMGVVFDYNNPIMGHPYKDRTLRLTEMPNMYKISRTERNKILAANQLSNFTLDLEFLAADVASNYVRETEFYPPLLHAQALLIALLAALDLSPNAQYTKSQERIMYIVNTVVKGMSADMPELNEAKKYLGTVQGITSKLLLAARPAAYVKELLYGVITNVLHSITYKGGSNEISIKNICKAVTTVLGNSIKKGLKNVGEIEDIMSLNLIHAINRTYGIAMQDLMMLSTANTHRGLNMTQELYRAYSASDLVNRMTIFIGKMLEDGSYEAHTFNEETQELEYDWKKDKRFSLLAEYGLNAKNQSEEYQLQRDLYKWMCNEFELEEKDLNGNNVKLCTWDEELSMYILKDIPRAYTAKQKNSINETIELAYGSYNHETKAPFVNKFLGHFFFQFQTFITGTWSRWFRSLNKNTQQGHVDYEFDANGEILYEIPEYDAEGNKIGMKKVPESSLTAEELVKYKDNRSIVYKQDLVEGIIRSFLYTIADITKITRDPEAWSRIVNNKARLHNLQRGILELLIGCLFAWLIRYIFSDGTNKMKNLNAFEKIAYKTCEAVGPLCLTEVRTNPAFLVQLGGLASDLPELVMGEDKTLQDVFNSRVGTFRDFYYEEPDV